MAKSKNGKEKDFTNEDLYRFLWNALKYREELSKDGEEFEPFASYEDAVASSSYPEFRNHVINKTLEDPSYAEEALAAYNDYFGTDYPYTKFSPRKQDQMPLNIDAMGADEVNAYSNRIARALGYADNERTNGALEDLIRKYYVDENGKFIKRGDIHAGVVGAIGDILKGDGEKRHEFLKALDLSSDLENNDIVNRLMPYIMRSRKMARYDSAPSGVKLVGSLLLPQVEKKRREGREADAVDGITDAVTLGLLAATRSPITAAGVGIAGDVVHDAIEEEGRPYVYETGENARSELGEWKDGVLKPERASDAILALVLGGGGKKGVGLAKGNRYIGHIIDKAEKTVEKGRDKLLNLFGKGNKATSQEKRAVTMQKKKVEKARKEAYEAEEDLKRTSPEKAFDTEEALGASIEDKAAKRIYAEEKANALKTESQKLAELLSKQNAPKESKALELLLRGARGAGNVAKGRVYDPNFYAVDMLGNFVNGLLSDKK